jgi:5-methylcytosine-specific restriction endonuclease McrA
MSEYKIGKLVFKTKKQALEYTRNKITTISYGKINKDNENFKFFKKLLKNLPEYEEKKGCGILAFNIERNAFNKSYHLTIDRKDGSNVDFSWNSCCKFNPRTPKQYLTKAMRDEINYQIQNFKKEAIYKCCICKTHDNNIEYHADHIIPFSKIKDDFLNDNELPVPVNFKDSINGTKLFIDDDYEFKNNWIKYHLRNTKLQILCQTCNLKKSNK